jgi:hypothetical protein
MPAQLQFAPVSLHPAENRGYRELYLTGRHLVERWSRVADALSGDAAEDTLRATSNDVREMLLELEPVTARHGLYGRLAAQGTGGRIGAVRAAVGDRFLERNQALRFAVDDLEHVMTLLAYLTVVSDARDHADLAEFARSWERRLVSHANAVRRAVVELGADPSAATRPLDLSPVGRAAHLGARAVGTVGEWVDRRVAGS